MRRRDLPIRLRLTAWYGLVLALALALFGAAMSVALERRLLAGVDRRLAERMDGLRAALAGEDLHSPAQVAAEAREFAAQIPDGTSLVLRDGAGAAVDLPAGPAKAPRRVYTGELRAAGRTWQVTLAAPLDEVYALDADFRRLLLLLFPAALALAAAGGYWLSSRALRPVDRITETARTIGVSNLSRRIPVPATGDEIERMAGAWNDVLARLEASVERMRRFTADASHELRTPLSLIRATAELALRRDRPPEDYRAALRAIEEQAELMTSLAESLLEAARLDEGPALPLARVDLTALAAVAAERHRALAGAKGVRLEARSEAATDVLANAAGVQRILAILLDNAIRHTPSGGSVTVAVSGTTLSVEDTGEGIAPADLPRIFDRFYRSDPARSAGAGFGLGLAIAQSIARAHVTEIRAESGPGRGARFSLDFRQYSDSARILEA